MAEAITGDINGASCNSALNPGVTPWCRRMGLLALALGSFCIGTTEFASMGILQLFSATLQVDLPSAAHAIVAYAIGVVIGAPLLTLTAAGWSRRTLLLALMGLFVVANVLSAMASSLEMLIVARFIGGLPQGAYFGAGTVVATYLLGRDQGGKAFALVMAGLTVATIVGSPLATLMGQQLGWRLTYLAIALLGAVSLAVLWIWVPKSSALAGGPVRQELVALRRGPVWLMLAVAATGVASIFAVYTFIGPLVTDLLHRPPALTPVALAVFGVGMTAGNIAGGHLADRHASAGLIGGFGLALLALALLGWQGTHLGVFLFSMFAVGATLMLAIPTIQVRLTALAPDAPTLMGAMNLAALNLSNALGAWAGGLAIGMTGNLLSASWAGFVVTSCGLVLFLAAYRASARSARSAPS